MKTKEEIEKLAEKYYTQITLSQRTAFKLGYTQCQEDMVNLNEQINKPIVIPTTDPSDREKMRCI